MANNKNSGKRSQYRRSNSSVNNRRKETDDLEKTNSLDIVIDNERLSDKESLDVSFIDGKRKKKKPVKIIEDIEKEDYSKYEEELDIPKKPRSEGLATFFIMLFSFILGFLICYIIAIRTDILGNVKVKTKTITKTEVKVVMDDNYVFLGDSIFEQYDLDKFYKDMPVVNSGISGNKTTDILNNMEERLYVYNPSKVFLMIGTNDFALNISTDDTVKNIGKIIEDIKKNRPYAEIYVQSIYPVNKSDDEKIDLDTVSDRNNEDIKSINDGIKEICKEKDVTYMNIYDLLLDEDGNLKLDYTVEGLHINDDGYEVITEEVMKVLNKE